MITHWVDRIHVLFENFLVRHANVWHIFTIDNINYQSPFFVLVIFIVWHFVISFCKGSDCSNKDWILCKGYAHECKAFTLFLANSIFFRIFAVPKVQS